MESGISCHTKSSTEKFQHFRFALLCGELATAVMVVVKKEKIRLDKHCI
jgi:hypothetical protein